MEETRVQEKSHFLKGLIVGGIIGGSFLLLDRKNRTKFKDSAKELTKVTKGKMNEMNSQQAVEQLKNVSSKVQEVIQESKGSKRNGFIYIVDKVSDVAKSATSNGQAVKKSGEEHEETELEDSPVNAYIDEEKK